MPEELSHLVLKETGDGSHTVYNCELNETYHSMHGAVTESKHVFIDSGLGFINNETGKINVLEVGFGTGLNAFMTCVDALEKNLKIYYTSIDVLPLPEKIIERLNYKDLLPHGEYFEKIHSAPWNVPVEIFPSFSIVKKNISLEDIFMEPLFYDLVYYDAFAPGKQPEMWEIYLLERVFNSMKTGGVLVTYCAQGNFQRNMKTIGFHVVTLPGPPGKKEIVRAWK